MGKNIVYKTVDLFGNEQIQLIEKKKTSNKTLFTDYEGFVDKFKAKKTTDDCYTPNAVYDVILEFVKQNYNLKGIEIIRPFYPDGDYESIEYPKNCIVIDNPPFSIVSKIARFYIENDIKFFLFAPHMTLFSSNLKCTAIVVGGDIIYENGAMVKTSFLSNIFSDVRILAAPKLYDELKNNGYHTIHCGKAHFGAIDTPGEDPHHWGFEVNIAGHAAGGLASYLGENNYGHTKDGKSYAPNAIPGLEKYWGSDTLATEALTQEAITAPVIS